MPKLKQVDSLQKMALDCAFNSVFNRCHSASAQGSIEELRRAISDIKRHVYICIPWYLLSDFIDRFFDEFFTIKRRPVNHLRAALEIMMDTKIRGLRFKSEMLWYTDHRDVHRIDGLTELDLQEANLVPEILCKCRLQDLIAFHHPKCIDAHLTVIGRNCAMLELLKIPYSSVTDEGLRSLSGCSELRVVDIVYCNYVTHIGLAHLYFKHKKLDELSYGTDIHRMESWCNVQTDILRGLDSPSKHPSLKLSFNEESMKLPLSVLNNMVAMFPNLTHLRIRCKLTLDMSKLKSLERLTGLDVFFSHYIAPDDCTAMWDSIKTLLTFIGANMTTLKLACYHRYIVRWHEEIDFIFEHCPNLEYLGFDHEDGLIVIPPFPKLKELVPRINLTDDRYDCNPTLNFRDLPSLETLCLIQYAIDFEGVISIILDHVTFPKLSLIEIQGVPDDELQALEKIIKDNNLDLKIKNHPMWEYGMNYRYVYVKDKLGYQSLCYNDNDSD